MTIKAISFGFDQVNRELQQMMFDMSAELEHLLHPLLPYHDWRSPDDVDLSATTVFAAARKAHAVASGQEWHRDVFEEDWLADLDRFYRLYESNDWARPATGRVVERLINAVMVINDLELGQDIEIARAADFFGMAEKTLRNALSGGRLVYGKSKGTITAASLKSWFKDKPNYRLPSSGGAFPTGIDPALAGAQPTRENLEALFHALGLVPHEKSRAPNKYMHAYRSGSLTFAHEHSRSTQHLWIPFARFEDPQEVTRRFVTRVYPATKPDADPYGRHSGLKKFPELATAKLLKISPRTTEEARIVLTMLDPSLASTNNN